MFNEMDSSSPVIYLLSAGADPTDSIEGLARKKKTDVACVSMGEVMIRTVVQTLNFLFKARFDVEKGCGWVCCTTRLFNFAKDLRAQIVIEESAPKLPDTVGRRLLVARLRAPRYFSPPTI